MVVLCSENRYDPIGISIGKGEPMKENIPLLTKIHQMCWYDI